MIEVTDPLTGEIVKEATDTPKQVRDLYETAKRLEDTAAQMRKDLKPHLQKVIDEHGDGKSYTFPDGKQLVHVSGQVMKVDPAKAYNLINDPDMFVELVSIPKGKYEEKMTEWLAEGKIDGIHPKDAIVPSSRANDHYALRKS